MAMEREHFVCQCHKGVKCTIVASEHSSRHWCLYDHQAVCLMLVPFRFEAVNRSCGIAEVVETPHRQDKHLQALPCQSR